ncbi:MAG: chemotaxis-specific protein-glutamate methyltransferase CheB [Stellaceae bacterium]
MIKVLVVDDSALVRRLFGRVLADETDFDVQFARNGVEALAQLHTFEPDVITLDIEMPQMDGLECLNRIMLERPCPVVIVSSVTTEGAGAAIEAMRLGAVDVMAKPGGAVSLEIGRFAPKLVEKVRAASQVKLKASLRLRERVRHRIGGAQPVPRRHIASGAGHANVTAGAAAGMGLVLVGTSTGGPPALEALLSALPAAFPWPILIAQHIPASFTGALARRLDALCAIRVTEALHSMRLEPGCAYIGRGDADLIVARQANDLVASPVAAEPGYPWHPSADRLVRSAMTHVATNRLVGVLMTGMGKDGAEAMAALRAAGGRTIAEAEETAIVWGMPGELVKAGGADWVLPLPKIAGRLQSLVATDAVDPSHI